MIYGRKKQCLLFWHAVSRLRTDNLSPLQDVLDEPYDFRLGDTSKFLQPQLLHRTYWGSVPWRLVPLVVLNQACGVNILNQECASKKLEILVSYSVCWDKQLVKLHVIATVCWQSLSGISGGNLFLVSKFHAVSSPLELFAICAHLLC
jgi:hypothetical protein